MEQDKAVEKQKKVNGGKWQKGKSGNPNGRWKRATIRNLSHLPWVIAYSDSVVRDPTRKAAMRKRFGRIIKAVKSDPEIMLNASLRYAIDVTVAEFRRAEARIKSRLNLADALYEFVKKKPDGTTS